MPQNQELRANCAPRAGAGLTRRALLRSGLAAGLARPVANGLAAGRRPVALYAGTALARYGFPAPHPFAVTRQDAFLRAATAAGLVAQVEVCTGRPATVDELRRFHDASHIAAVAVAESAGRAALDQGDTPVFAGLYAAACQVAGSALDGLAAILDGRHQRSFQPVGGLHHAWPDRASGFCVFNDVGVLLATLRRVHGLERVAYVDIDVHHGDGVFYAFEDDPGVIIADIHQDGRTLFPGTGLDGETGSGAAIGTKLNIALPPRAGDADFMAVWPRVEAHLERHAPAFIVLQCGADGLAGDPLGDLRYTAAVHAHVARRLRAQAERHAGGRLMAFGGGGYDAENLAQAWCAVLRELLA